MLVSTASYQPCIVERLEFQVFGLAAVISDTTKPAPKFLQIFLNGKSVIPAMGASMVGLLIIYEPILNNDFAHLTWSKMIPLVELYKK